MKDEAKPRTPPVIRRPVGAAALSIATRVIDNAVRGVRQI